MEHPGKILLEQIKDRGWTQKQFASFVGKKNSEVNELIKGKRNITVQWDLILSEVLGTPQKYWINMQVDYDYELVKRELEQERQSQGQQEPQVVGKDGEPEDKGDGKEVLPNPPQVGLPESVGETPELSQSVNGDTPDENKETQEKDDFEKKIKLQKILLNF